LGLSATVIRKDGQHPIVMMNLGDVRYSSSQVKMAPAFIQKVFPRFTGYQLSMDIESSNLNFHDVTRELWADEARNALIVEDILNAHHEGRECLVLSDRLEHLVFLENALQGRVSNLFTLKGGMGKKQIKTVMDSLQSVSEDGRRVILATGQYIGEGFDLPFLDTLFLVFPFSWKGKLTQYTGRLNRTYYGKKEIHVYDYVDEKVPMLSRMYGRRLKGYKDLGFAMER
jgi:superfamily II DNA or RNA helicase